MATVIEAGQRQTSSEIAQAAQLIQETSRVETAHNVPIIKDNLAITTILKSNNRVSRWLDRCFLATGSLSKRTFGSIGRVSTVLNGLSRMVRGL
ncbi:MAG: hypothetical protein GF416_04010 [Candidatus Altiarchaeales archaeon]|nr:hypothetical protein [Candidatus Altiarchaeales archaeon]MBD3416284.1 hypothetical protein [Candidatus Altiarchaeales archaeon]